MPEVIAAVKPAGFTLPAHDALAAALKAAIDENKAVFKQTVVQYNDDLKKGGAVEEKSAEATEEPEA